MWGYKENQEKNSILIKAENQYQRAFHDLSFHVDKLHTELGNTLAVNTTSQGYHRKGLVNAWRITSQAQNEINQLPLSLLPFNKTEEFLANIANFTYRTAVRDLTKQPLSPEELKQSKELYARSKEISSELRSVQAKTIKNNLRSMVVELALATENTTYDNTIIDGFKTVNKKVGEYSELNWGPSMTSIDNKHSIKALSGPKVTAEQIKTKAQQFFHLQASKEIKVVENGNGTEYSSFSVTAQNPKSNNNLQADYTKVGGQLIYFMNTRDVKAKKISTDEAVESASKFLVKNKYGQMEPVSYDLYDNIAHFTFAAKQGNVVIYPEKLSIMVALDDGEVTGLQATDYIYHNKKRKLKKPVLNLEEAKKALNPSFKLRDDGLALIENELNQEVLCYEFIGSIKRQ